MRLLGWLRRVIFSLPKAILMVCLGAVTGAVFLEVLMRHILFVQFYGIEEIITFWSAYLYFGSMAYVTYKKTHLSVEVLSSRVRSPRLSQGLNIASAALVLIVCAVYAYLAARYANFVLVGGQVTPDLGYPRIALVLSVVGGFVAMSVFVLWDLSVQISRASKRGKKDGAS